MHKEIEARVGFLHYTSLHVRRLRSPTKQTSRHAPHTILIYTQNPVHLYMYPEAGPSLPNLTSRDSHQSAHILIYTQNTPHLY